VPRFMLQLLSYKTPRNDETRKSKTSSHKLIVEIVVTFLTSYFPVVSFVILHLKVNYNIPKTF
jgi:hypothetical protein